MTTTPRSIAEWISLPQLPIGRIARPQETGIIYQVVTVGMLVVSVSDCRKMDVSEAQPMVGDQTVLPTVTIQTDAGPKLHRLPLPLAPWVALTCAQAEQGTKLLPGEVEFSDLNGRISADLH